MTKSKQYDNSKAARWWQINMTVAKQHDTGKAVGLEKISSLYVFCFSFMLDKSTFISFLIHPFCSLFHPLRFPNIPFLQQTNAKRTVNELRMQPSFQDYLKDRFDYNGLVFQKIDSASISTKSQWMANLNM